MQRGDDLKLMERQAVIIDVAKPAEEEPQIPLYKQVQMWAKITLKRVFALDKSKVAVGQIFGDITNRHYVLMKDGSIVRATPKKKRRRGYDAKRYSRLGIK